MDKKEPAKRNAGKKLESLKPAEPKKAAIPDQPASEKKSTVKAGVHSCEVYVKPEEGMAYYVIVRVQYILDTGEEKVEGRALMGYS